MKQPYRVTFSRGDLPTAVTFDVQDKSREDAVCSAMHLLYGLVGVERGCFFRLSSVSEL